MRLSGRTVVVLGGFLGLLVLYATDQIVPATSQYQAQMRLWLAGRATGMTAYVLLTVVITLGLILSHPVNQSTWKLSKRIFPWHENLFAFLIAFIAAHIVSLVLDPYAGVGVEGAFIPGLSSYRSVPVALGTLSLYALIVAGLTARYTRLLPTGYWLKLHRVSIGVFVLAWTHGVLAGTDSDAFRAIYAVSGLVVIFAAAYRYWVAKKRRPTFASSLPGATRGRPSEASPLGAASAPRPEGGVASEVTR